MNFLRGLVDAGRISSIDAYVAEALVRRAHEPDIAVALACACLMKAQGEGDVCLHLHDLAQQVDEWTGTAPLLGTFEPMDAATWGLRLFRSPLVSQQGDRPLVLDGQRLYLQRSWNYECRIADALASRICAPDVNVASDSLAQALRKWFPTEPKVSLAPAAAGLLAGRRSFLVITGGPGTGKTTVLGRLVGLLTDMTPRLRMGIAAPTGKGAERAERALRAAFAQLDVGGTALAGLDEAVTLHRLLGARQGASEFHYHQANPLPLDVLFVDEASMIDARMMAHLLDALPARCKLILLGDPDQLSAVEAGAVLGEICRVAEGVSPSARNALRRSMKRESNDLVNGVGKIPNTRIVFRQRHRFAGNEALGALADAVQAGESTRALELLRDAPGLRFVALDECNESEVVSAAWAGYQVLRGAASTTGPAEPVLARLGDFQLLSPYRYGAYGTERLNQLIEAQGMDTGSSDVADLQPGTPIIVVRNDYDAGLFNGDAGVVLPTLEGVRAVFLGGDGARSFAATRLPATELGFALTVHKAQGSEYEHVMLVLPQRESHSKEPLLSRQLLYTAITRARAQVTVWSTEDTLVSAIGTLVHRSSGLGERLLSSWRAASPNPRTDAVQQSLF